MIHKTYQVSMEVAGDTALWTRPDTGDSPCSYPAPTYSAVRGLFESILWGPAVQIIPRKVELCSAPQYHSYATNYGGPLRKSSLISKDNNYQLFATVLTGVCYRLYADVIPNPNKEKLPDRAREWDRRTTSPGARLSGNVQPALAARAILYDAVPRMERIHAVIFRPVP